MAIWRSSGINNNGKEEDVGNEDMVGSSVVWVIRYDRRLLRVQWFSREVRVFFGMITSVTKLVTQTTTPTKFTYCNTTNTGTHSMM